MPQLLPSTVLARACVKALPQIHVRGARGTPLSCVCGPHRYIRARAAQDSENSSGNLVGEDAATFAIEEQTKEQWTRFFIVLGVVTGVLLALINLTPVFDFFVEGFEEALVEPQYAMVGILAFFALCHSGLAFLRPYGEELVGARAWRVLFGSVSLPLAAVAVFYFINHRYDGTPLWNVQGTPGLHTALWIANFVSFLFLYPSTFNLLEVAAVDKPELHLWETGVTRITRHPQAWGQLLWCAAHTVWIGNSFMLWTSGALCAHHFLAMPHGDFRLRRKYGAAFDAVEARTSVVPFAAIADGRQRLPADYWREWARVPYAAVCVFAVGAYFAHPYLQLIAYNLNW